jgi:hypothetical protein
VRCAESLRVQAYFDAEVDADLGRRCRAPPRTLRRVPRLACRTSSTCARALRRRRALRAHAGRRCAPSSCVRSMRKRRTPPAPASLRRPANLRGHAPDAAHGQEGAEFLLAGRARRCRRHRSSRRSWHSFCSCRRPTDPVLRCNSSMRPPALAAAGPSDRCRLDRQAHRQALVRGPRRRLAGGHADFEAQGYRLVGGRADYLDHQRSAVVVYRHGAHVINVFSWAGGEPGAAGPMSPASGYHLAFWQGRRFAVLRRLGHRLGRAAGPGAIAQGIKVLRQSKVM